MKTRSNSPLLLAGIASAWLLLPACGGAGGSAGGTTALDDPAYAGPIASTNVERGAEIYEQSCGDCHPGGRSGYGPGVRDLQFTPAHMRKQIREGERRMPGFTEADLDPEHLEHLLAYLASIGAVRASE